MCYYSMGFYWTKNRHKYKQALPNKRRENTGGKGTQGHLHIYILPLLCSSVQKYLQKIQ